MGFMIPTQQAAWYCVPSVLPDPQVHAELVQVDTVCAMDLCCSPGNLGLEKPIF